MHAVSYAILFLRVGGAVAVLAGAYLAYRAWRPDRARRGRPDHGRAVLRHRAARPSTWFREAAVTTRPGAQPCATVSAGNRLTSNGPPSRCSLCGRLHRPLPGRCSAGLETVACSESGRWLCREPDGEWRRCEHWAIDAVFFVIGGFPLAPRLQVLVLWQVAVAGEEADRRTNGLHLRRVHRARRRGSQRGHRRPRRTPVAPPRPIAEPSTALWRRAPDPAPALGSRFARPRDPVTAQGRDRARWTGLPVGLAIRKGALAGLRLGGAQRRSSSDLDEGHKTAGTSGR